MNQLFNPDSPVLGFINKIVYCVYLNILWLVCSLPIVTIGASTTALFYVTLKMAKNESTQNSASNCRDGYENSYENNAGSGSNSAKNKSTNKSTNKTSNVSGSNKTSDKYQQ